MDILALTSSTISFNPYIAVVILLGLLLFGFIAYTEWAKFKKQHTTGPPGTLDENPVMLVINLIALALDLTQDTLLRMRRLSGDKLIDAVVGDVFTELYTYILKNRDMFDPRAVDLLTKMDRDAVSKICAGFIKQFIQKLDAILAEQDARERSTVDISPPTTVSGISLETSESEQKAPE